MSQSATPATQSEGGCHKVPRLPRKTPRRHSAAWEPSAPPEPGQPSAISATPATLSNNPCHQVPRLPHKVKVDVTKCHACHAKRRGVTAPPGNQARHQSQTSASSAMPATQSNNPCHQVPRLPHKVNVDVTKCHACHAKRVVCEQVVCEQVVCVCVQVVCECKLCVSKLCVSKLYVSKLYVSKLCV